MPVVKIANPIYDTIFKYLMEDLDIASDFLSLILETPILALEFCNKEGIRTVLDTGPVSKRFGLYHLDFKALITDEKGEQKKVIIELQKGFGHADLYRFRDYLGNEYLPKKTKVKNPKNTEYRQYTDLKVYDESEDILPLICIYILGFPLKDKLLIIKRKGQFSNQNNDLLAVNDPFIKCVNHDFYAIQITEIPETPKTELETVLSVFEQSFLDEDKSWLKKYEHVLDHELLKRILKKLQLLANDENIAKEIEQEEKGRLFLEHHDREWKKALREKDKALHQEKTKKKQEEAKRKQEEAKRKQEEAKRKQEEAKRKQLKAQLWLGPFKHKLSRLSFPRRRESRIVNRTDIISAATQLWMPAFAGMTSPFYILSNGSTHRTIPTKPHPIWHESRGSQTYFGLQPQNGLTHKFVFVQTQPQMVQVA
jgi:hypothetical protein